MIKSVAAALACGICVVAMATPAQAQTREYRIPAGSLKSALDAYARQSGRQVIYKVDDIRRARSPGANGNISAEAALAAILAGTGFRAQGDSSGALAIVRTNVADSASTEQTSTREADAESSEEIVVTGSNIRGGNPTAPVFQYGRQEIEKTGYGTTQDFIRSLPTNFRGGGLSEDSSIGGGALSGVNRDAGTAVNLRGLGAGSTLVLLNGRRMAPTGNGAAVDVSKIPLGAVQRVEVLPDGASAIYGADAVGGVVNFVLRRDYEGAETSLRAATATSGGRQEYIASQLFGQAWNSGNALLSFQYRRAEPLSTASRDFTEAVPRPTDILPSVRDYSVIFSGRQDVSSNIDVFADVLYSHRTLRQFRSTRTVSTFNRANIDFLTATGGVGFKPFGDWRVEAVASYSLQDLFQRPTVTPSTAFTLGDLFERFELQDFGAKADGTLFEIPGGSVKAALGAGYRTEDFSSFFPKNNSTRTFDRDVVSLFGELSIPLVGASNSGPFVDRLLVSAAVRYEDYSDFGSTTNPKFGVLWSPVNWLDFRASYGTSFRAPSPFETTQASTSIIALLPGFLLPSGSVGRVLLLQGGSELRPERSKNLTLGAEVRPPFAPGLTLTAGYYRLRYRDRIVTPPTDVAALTKPDIYGPLIISFANDAAALQFVQQRQAAGSQFFDLTGLGLGGVRFAFDRRLANSAQLDQSGFDLGARYTADWQGGRLDLSANASLINEIDVRFCEACTPTDTSDTFGQPLHLRMRGQASWTTAQWQVNAAVNHSGSYDDTTVIPPGTIGTYTTFDLNVRYSPAAIKGFTVSLDAINLFDREPPLTGATGVGALGGVRYDAANADALGRVIAIQLRQRW